MSSNSVMASERERARGEGGGRERERESERESLHTRKYVYVQGVGVCTGVCVQDLLRDPSTNITISKAFLP